MIINSQKNKTQKLITDSAITTKLKGKYLIDNALNAFDIHILTEDGEVFLSGKSLPEDLLNKAIEIAKDTEGVKGVVFQATS